MNKTLLDEFACVALGIVLEVLPSGHVWTFENLAQASYDMAEAMIAESAKRNSGDYQYKLKREQQNANQ